MTKAYHGGAFFNAIGSDFQTLEKKDTIISADVLDAWFDPAPAVIDKIQQYMHFGLKTSPPTHCDGLIQTISEVREIPKDNIVVGGGSSDLMFSLLPNLINNTDTAMILDPMYGEYQHIFDHVIGCRLERFVLLKEENFVVDIEKLLHRVQEVQPNILVIVNPNSPTGQRIPIAELVTFCDQVPGETFVLIDECYIDYTGESDKIEKHVASLPNTGVIKSMSKAYALSGARVAYAVLPLHIKEKVEQFTPPWAVSLLGQIAGVEALKNEEYYKEKYSETKHNKQIYLDALQQRGDIKVYDSEANFVLIELYNRSAQKVCAMCQEHGVFIRNCDSMSSQFNDNFVRLAVKDSIQTQQILNTFIDVL